jgi:uncharacterized caspase-like protein
MQYLFLLAVLLGLAAPALQAQVSGSAERRVALVVGNSNYKQSPLKNPKNDARAVSAALRKLNFEVIERQDLGRESFSLAIRDFGDRLKGASVGLFYYAGHGLQVKGRNYLVPVDVDIAREDEVPYRGLDINEVLDKMDSARTPVNVVMLDACRNNPFARSFKLNQVGLAQMDAPQGTLISFATAPGSVAQDGEGVNGLFTGALLKHIDVQGLAIEQMLKRVRVDVMRGSNGQQVPWESSSLNRDFAFAQAAATVTPVTAPLAPVGTTELALELAFWESVSTSRNAADYRAYLEQYPLGRFAALARIRSQSNVVNTPAATAVTAQSPEGLYMVSVSAGQLQWVEMETGNVVRRTRWAADPQTELLALEFSPTGRWLLMKLGRQTPTVYQTRYQLIDVSTGLSVWEKPALLAAFEAERPTIVLQDRVGQSETVDLPS